MEETEKYFENNASKLHRVIDGLLYKFKCNNYDAQDFYSIGNEVFVSIIQKYDTLDNFDALLYTALSNRIKNEITKRNRYKRKADNLVISIDAPLTENGFTIGDTLVSDFDLKEHLADFQDEKVEKYLSSLSKLQRKIVEMKMNGYTIIEIKDKLALSVKKYEYEWQAIQSFEKIKVLYTNHTLDREEEKMEVASITIEKSKSKSYSIFSIIKKIENCTLRFDYPLQREADQWGSVIKGNLISDILQGNPIPALVFAEQMIDGMSIVWNLDGKQKCTNAYNFYKGGYKIARNIRRWNIRFQSIKRDENGNPVLNENNIPLSEWKEFDIRGKKYSDLPEELQERFNDYTFECTQYLNCSSEDIAYHIARYNEGKPMTVSQKGLTRLGEQYATFVKSISSMSFFKDCGDYRASEFRNGTINRIIVESIITVNYITDWNKKTEEMCKYIHDNAKETDFENLEELINRLTDVVTEDVTEMFNSRDTFLWFGLFARFTKLGLEDSRFIGFLQEFNQLLREKEINDTSYQFIDTAKNTKDKKVVIGKMRHLEILMNDYFNTVNIKCA